MKTISIAVSAAASVKAAINPAVSAAFFYYYQGDYCYD